VVEAHFFLCHCADPLFFLDFSAFAKILLTSEEALVLLNQFSKGYQQTQEIMSISITLATMIVFGVACLSLHAKSYHLIVLVDMQLGQQGLYLNNQQEHELRKHLK
jgi:hypothetical protein